MAASSPRCNFRGRNFSHKALLLMAVPSNGEGLLDVSKTVNRRLCSFTAFQNCLERLYQKWYGMANGCRYSLEVVFYRTGSDSEPVREWLKRLTKEDKKTIGGDIKTVQYGWPLSMPVVHKLDRDLWEVRSRLDNHIARMLFTIYEDKMVLLQDSSRNRRRHRWKI